jgi:hypothetical protein
VHLTIEMTAVLTRHRRRHGRRVRVRPIVSYEAELIVDVDYTPGMPGRHGGPSERCYPDEPADVEVLWVRDAETSHRLDWTPTKAQQRELAARARARFEDACGEAAFEDFEGRW